MKHTISCSGVAIGKVESFEATIDAMAAAGYDTIDFWPYVYSEDPNGPLNRENWREWCQYARDYMEARSIRPGQCHCQWQKTHSFSEGTHIDPPAEVYHRTIEACHILGCRQLIYHPPFYIKRVPDEATRMAILDAQAGWFRHLLPDAERFDVELHLENTFDFRHVQLPGDPPYVGIAAWEMLYLAKQLDHPLVKICIDTGHARLANQDVPAMIREVGSMLGSLHLNDNFGVIGPIYEDLHMFPGYGDLDWDAIFTALRDISYAGTLNMEPGSPLRNGKLDGHIVKLRAAKELLATMAVRAGFDVR